MLRRFLTGTLGLLAIVAIYAFATAPQSIEHEPATPDIGASLDTWLRASEADVHRRTPIIPGAEKRVRWYAGQEGSRTPISIVYLHGFSATRQEIAPVSETLADELGANLFETRLAGHGLEVDPLHDIVAEQWLDDAAEALTIGTMIGDRVVVVGVSTGATLALAMAEYEAFDDVAALVLMSPNFAPYDSTAEMLTKPGGPQLARLMVGENHSWEAANAEQERYWSTTYPMAAVIEMMRLVDLTRSQLPLQLSQPVLTLFSPEDTVINTEEIRRSLELIDSPGAELVEITESDDRSNHVLAGDILSPGNNQVVVDHIVRFITAADL